LDDDEQKTNILMMNRIYHSQNNEKQLLQSVLLQLFYPIQEYLIEKK
jgi:hypothetical protein